MKPYTWHKFRGYEQLKQADVHGGDVLGEVTNPVRYGIYTWWARTANGRVSGTARSSYAAQRAVRKVIKGDDE